MPPTAMETKVIATQIPVKYNNIRGTYSSKNTSQNVEMVVKMDKRKRKYELDV